MVIPEETIDTEEAPNNETVDFSNLSLLSELLIEVIKKDLELQEV